MLKRLLPSARLCATRLRPPSTRCSSEMTTPDPRENRLIWFDGEMTGLEDEHRLVEVACVITEPDLTEVASYGPVVIHQDEQVLKDMNSWCKKTFKKNGLLELIRQSQVTEQQVDEELKAFLEQHTPFFKCPLAGNSVSEDRRFINRYLPAVAKHLHYRTVDVSTIKELTKRWLPAKFEAAPPKNMMHRSLDDVYESIAELRYYRDHVFVRP